MSCKAPGPKPGKAIVLASAMKNDSMQMVWPSGVFCTRGSTTGQRAVLILTGMPPHAPAQPQLSYSKVSGSR
ncbi:hypothetical protein D3C72_2477650 [compost metagenome]